MGWLLQNLHFPGPYWEGGDNPNVYGVLVLRSGVFGKVTATGGYNANSGTFT